MIMYRRELKNNVKNEFMRNERDYEDLQELIEITIELDDKLYERVMKKRYDYSKNKTELIYEPTVRYVKSKHQSYIRNSEYTELASMKLDITQQRKGKNSKNKKKSKEKLCYECEKTDHFVRNCRNENVMLRRQLNVTLKRISETDDTEETDNKIKTLKISSNDEYCIVNSMTKLQKVIDAASTKRINERIEKFRRSSTSHSNCTKAMSRSDLKYDYDDQTEQVMNETFKGLEALISSSSNQEKKEQYAKRIVDTFEKILDSDVNIKSRIKSIEKQSKLLNTT